jgi:hypothetical protein
MRNKYCSVKNGLLSLAEGAIPSVQCWGLSELGQVDITGWEPKNNDGIITLLLHYHCN